ncbi:hypothetical protein [Myxococcus sp. CA039A]|uniref:hypothetical protein n=1 Tax=Myxococcus sp. CA039A TaxID=2741737 RepID=UPI00157BA03B|nr:hypothetical protein [Myxococcus sp. CA039A]NTX51859.1 hypothetical protein [Myxococcus sp. CA039A]
MSVTRDDAEKLYLVLMRATQSGEVAWSRRPIGSLATHVASRINGFFTTTHEEADFGLLELVSRAYNADTDEYFDVDGAELVLLDGKQQVITYTFPFAESLPRLLSAVKAQTSDAENVLKRILNAAKGPK